MSATTPSPTLSVASSRPSGAESDKDVETNTAVSYDWPGDALDLVTAWSRIWRDMLTARMKKRTWLVVHAELLKIWVQRVFIPRCDELAPAAMEFHPEGNFMDDEELICGSIYISLAGVWGINDPSTIQHICDEVEYDEDLFLRDDWISVITEWEDVWTSAVTDLKHIFRCESYM